MPRDRRAVIGTAIWREDSILALTWSQQHAYFLVYTQADLNKCGVIAYRPKRWAGFAKNLTERQLRRDCEGMHKTRHTVLDEDYDELLVRTYVGHDGLLAQPLVVVAMVRDFQTVASPIIRLEVLRELRRLWSLARVTDAERRGILLILGADPDEIGLATGRDGMQQRIRDGIGAGLTAEVSQAIDREELDPWPDDPAGAFADVLAKGYGKGSGQRVCQRDGARSPAPPPLPTPLPPPYATDDTGSGHDSPDVTRENARS